jgi:hypothetical protein
MSNTVAVILPKDFDDYFWDSKGFFPCAKLVTGNKQFIVNFYTAQRLFQDASDELKEGKFFIVPNLIIVDSINRKSLETAAEAVGRIQSNGGLSESYVG